MKEQQPLIDDNATRQGFEVIPGQQEENRDRRNGRFKAEAVVGATIILIESGMVFGNYIRRKLHRRSMHVISTAQTGGQEVKADDVSLLTPEQTTLLNEVGGEG